MLKLKTVDIENFKSIKELSIDFIKHPNTIMLGKNGSGKSNIIEALSFLKNDVAVEDKKYSYSDYANKKISTEKEHVDIYYNFKIVGAKLLQGFSSSLISEEAVKLLKVKGLSKNVYISKKSEEEDNESLNVIYNITIEDSILKKVCLHRYSKMVGNIQKNYEVVKAVSEFPDGTAIDSIEDLLRIISDDLEPFLEDKIPNVSLWSPHEKYKLPSSVNLSKFVSEEEECVPLMHLLKMCGFKDEESIYSHISNILKPGKAAEKHTLARKLKTKLNKFITKIWGNSNYKFNITIDGSILYFHLHEDNNEDNLLTINSLSDGYRQFISLILGLSLDIESNKVKNNLLLIDEPEIHLYPKSISFIRDELFKLGKDNLLMVSTHSPYMINHLKKTSYAKVDNDNLNTTINYFQEDESLADDCIFYSVFGIGFMSELLAGKILLVEGSSDKSALYKSLPFNSDIKIIPCRGSNIIAMSRILSNMADFDSTKILALVDSDADGKNYKKAISKLDNIIVLEIADADEKLKLCKTLEDLYDLESVKKIIKKENSDFEYNESKQVMANLESLFHKTCRPEDKDNADAKLNFLNKLKKDISAECIKTISLDDGSKLSILSNKINGIFNG